MFVNMTTTVRFPRRMLIFEIPLSHFLGTAYVPEKAPFLVEVLEEILKNANQDIVLNILSTMFELHNMDKSSWSVDMVNFDFMVQNMQVLVASPSFPVSPEGLQIQCVGNKQQLQEILKGAAV